MFILKLAVVKASTAKFDASCFTSIVSPFKQSTFATKFSELKFMKFESCVFFRFTEIILFETFEEIDNEVKSSRNRIVMHYLSTL